MKAGVTQLIRYIRAFRFHSVVVRNFLMITLVLALSFASVSYVVYRRMNQIVRDEVSSISASNLYSVRDVIEGIFQDLHQVSSLLTIDERVSAYLRTPSTDPILLTLGADISTTLSYFQYTYDSVDSVYLYSEINGLYSAAGLTEGDALDDGWLELYATDTTDADPIIVPRLKYGIFPRLVSLIDTIQLPDQTRLGAVVVNVNIDILGDLIRSQSSEVTPRVYVVDADGRMIFSYDGSDFLEPFTAVSLDRFTQPDSQGETQIISSNGLESVVSVTRSEYRDYWYVSVFPLAAYTQRLESIRSFVIVLVALSVLAAFFISALIAVRAFGPFLRILSIFESPSRLSEYQSGPGSVQNDEVRLMAQNVVRTLLTNQQLAAEMEKQMELLNQAQATALQGQINPHFLYNTLESIRWLVVANAGGESKASGMISSLAKLLRLSLESDDKVVTIRKELEHARLYLDVMLVRYADKVSVEWEIDESVMDYMITKIVLQPLIENAIYHGMKHLDADGILRIRVAREANTIMLSVEDNGPGMGPDAMRRMNAKLRESVELPRGSIGLQNVNQRIKMTMGDEFGIELGSNGTQGFCVSLRVPLLEGNESIPMSQSFSLPRATT